MYILTITYRTVYTHVYTHIHTYKCSNQLAACRISQATAQSGNSRSLEFETFHTSMLFKNNGCLPGCAVQYIHSHLTSGTSAIYCNPFASPFYIYKYNHSSSYIMKILSSEEIKEQQYQTLKGGLIGTVAGIAVSVVGFRVLPKRYPSFKPSALPWSIKTALYITPPTILSVICAEEASNEFDKKTYSGDYHTEAAKIQTKEWAQLSWNDKMVTTLNAHKYKLIIGIWAGSLWGSWHIINKDKIMTQAQKAVQARMYAQFITVLLLLASIGLSQYEDKLNPDKKKNIEHNRWTMALKAAEKAEREEKQAAKNFKSNDDRVSARIYK